MAYRIFVNDLLTLKYCRFLKQARNIKYQKAMDSLNVVMKSIIPLLAAGIGIGRHVSPRYLLLLQKK
jgi:hypothetical protein